MLVISLANQPHFAPVKDASGRFGIDHDQARRENREPELAMSRTEPSAYSHSFALSLTLR
jgi:hypothetical protein